MRDALAFVDGDGRLNIAQLEVVPHRPWFRHAPDADEYRLKVTTMDWETLAHVGVERERLIELNEDN